MLLLLIVLIWLNSGTSEGPAKPRDDEGSGRIPGPPDEESTQAVPEPQQGQPAVAAQETGGRFEIVADDGQQPWQSPTEGQPVSLRYLPPGSQVFLMIRPADLLASAEGPRILQALGPPFARTQAAWEAAAGLPLGEIQQLIVSFHDHGDPLPRPTLVVRPKTPVAKDALLQKWGKPGLGRPVGRHVHRRQRLVLPPAGRWPRQRVRRRTSGRNRRDPRRAGRFRRRSRPPWKNC